MKKKSFYFLLLFCLVTSVSAWAEIRLPAVIGSHMVLQQNTNAKLWGWCEPGEKITIKTSWDTSTYTATGTANAKWNVTIKTPVAGGPYTITLKGNNTIELEDVLIGEVWLCSGQSNMEMNINWGLNYADDVANAHNKSIRFFHIPRLTANYPQDDTKARWVVSTPEEMKRFSAVGYFFGTKLQQELGVPVGLINSSWGGTPAEVWTPEDAVNNDPTLKDAASKLKTANGWPVHPGATYNAMIHPLTNYNIAGALWYQGESNTATWDTYQPLLTSMIDSWRKAFNTEFPFYLVQIAPYAGYGNHNIAPLMQETQTKIAEHPKTGMVVINDLVDNIKDIHPKLKKEVGIRLANYALAETYGKSGFVYKSPMYQSMRVEKNKIRIYFDHADNGLISKNGAPREFYIAGEDQNFFPAMAKVEGNSVVIWSRDVKKPVAVRYAFRNDAQPNLFSKEGLPVNLFRTDDWEVDTSAVKKP